jgi:lipoate-protein ligase A
VEPKRDWRWIYETIPRQNPVMNMAVDAAVLERFLEGDALPVIRIYRWKNSAVTIGKAQDFEEARRIYYDKPCIRRPTGGKAVLHGDDLTITVVASNKDLLINSASHGVLASFRMVIDGIIGAIESQGGKSRFGNSSAPGRHSDPNCFALSSRCDLVDERTGLKVMGSAQLRRKGAVLQQMSLRPLNGMDIHSYSFAQSLRKGFQSALGISNWIDEDISQIEDETAEKSLISWEYSGVN